MHRHRWTFVLAVLCIVAFGCSQDGGSGFDNPVAPATLTSVTDEVQEPPVLICHNDVDDDHPYDSIAIEVNGNSAQKHYDNHGDCDTGDAVGTENCSCLF